MLARSGTGSMRSRRRCPEQPVQHRFASTHCCGACFIMCAYGWQRADPVSLQTQLPIIMMPRLLLPQPISP